MTNDNTLRAAVERVRDAMIEHSKRNHTPVPENTSYYYAGKLTKALAADGDVPDDGRVQRLKDLGMHYEARIVANEAPPPGTIAAADVAVVRDKSFKPDYEFGDMRDDLTALITAAGSPAPQEVCEQCGKTEYQVPGARFCLKCGNKMLLEMQGEPQVPLAVVDDWITELCRRIKNRGRHEKYRNACSDIANYIDKALKPYRPAPAPSTDGPEPCATCGGEGFIDGVVKGPMLLPKRKPCPDCQPPQEMPGYSEDDDDVVMCPDCGSTNKTGATECYDCKVKFKPTPPTQADRATYIFNGRNPSGVIDAGYAADVCKGKFDAEVIAWRDGKGDV